jgi:hypothetical protein
MCVSLVSSCLKEILEKQKAFEFDIGMRCISILHYLIEFSDNIPLCAISRMLTIHDVPYLFVQLIEKQPWKKHDEEGNLFPLFSISLHRIPMPLDCYGKQL